MTNSIAKYNPYNAKVWSNHPVNKDPNPGNIDNNYSDFPPALIAGIIVAAVGAGATITSAAVNSAAQKKAAKSQQDLLKIQAAAQETALKLQTEAALAVQAQKSKQYQQIAIIGIVILVICIAGLILFKKKKII